MEKPNSVQEQVETKVDEVVTVEESIAVEEEVTPKTEPLGVKKSDDLIAEARSLIEESDLSTRSCMEILEEDVERYEEAKAVLVNESIHPSEALLKKVGFDSSIEEEFDDEEAINFEDIKQVEPIYVRELSSGKFGALILSLLAGFAVVLGWIYIASNALDIVMDINKISTPQIQNQIFLWIGGGMTGGEGNAMMGMAIVALSALATLWVVFAMKVFLRESQNYKIAQKVKEDAEFYCTKKEECQREMEKVSTHINEVISAIETSKIYLNEQNATIQRIVYIESDRPFEELHQKSQEEISNTNILINGIKQLISTPMASENGTLSEDARVVLAKTQRRQETYREKLYS